VVELRTIAGWSGGYCRGAEDARCGRLRAKGSAYPDDRYRREKRGCGRLDPDKAPAVFYPPGQLILRHERIYNDPSQIPDTEDTESRISLTTLTSTIVVMGTFKRKGSTRATLRGQTRSTTGTA
jgi:hypothetical protein